MTTASSPREQVEGSLSLGPWLKQRRRQMDITQDELAQRSLCSLATIRKIEAGDLLPSKQLAQQIAAALGLPEAEYSAFVTFARAERATLLATAFAPANNASASFLHAPAEPARRRYQVPAQLTPLVGREWEVQASCTLLRRPVARLLTLTGPPGSGKTRLALAIAEELQREFAGGALFVPLAPISDGNLVPNAISQALGIRAGAGQQLLDTLLEVLREQQLLLVLDNFEQVVDSAPFLTELLMASAGLKLVVTSRIVLKLYGEHVFPVPPLPLPDPDEPHAPDELLLYPGVELFAQRALAVRPTFAITRENAAAVIQICTWVEGLPLAIEMAAAQVKWYSPQTLAGQLGQRLAALSGGARYLAPRQQTLRGAIEWSYNLLDENEQRLFDGLGVFVGGCTSDAVTAVLGGGSLLAGKLQSLVDHSLLKDYPSLDMPARYEMLETIREYALERLAARREAVAIAQAHAAFFLSLAQEALAELAGANQEDWLDRLEDDEDNLRAALAWCLQHNIEMGLRLGTALGEYWYMRGDLSEGRSQMAKLLAPSDQPVAIVVRADALHTTGYLAFRQGDHLEALPDLQESLALYRSLEHSQGIAGTLHHLGVVAFHQNQYAEAQALYEQSLALYQASGQAIETAIVLKDLGLVAKDRGELTDAMAYFERSLALQRSAGNTHGIARCLTSMSLVAYWQADYALAAELAWQSLALQRELGDRLGIAYTLENLGMALYKLGNFDVAAQQMEECLALFRSTGDKMGVVLALDNLGILALAKGKSDEAHRYHGESLAIAWQIREKRRIAFCFEGLGAATTQSERAVQLFAGADALRAAIDAPMLPADRAAYEEQLSTLRAQLGGEGFAKAWQEGAARSLEEAVYYALSY